jgi:hypothetical protein
MYLIGVDGEVKNIVKTDRFGNVIRTWENAGPDHFAHANVYYMVARLIKYPAARERKETQHDYTPTNTVTNY